MNIRKKTRQSEYNPFLISEIQPQGGISFKDNYILKADGYEACIYIYYYNTEVIDFWLTNFSKKENVIVTIDIATSEKQKVLKNLNKSLVEQENRYHSDNNKLGKIKAQHSYHKLSKLAQSVTTQGEKIKEIHTRIFVSSKTKSDLDKEIKSILEDLEALNFRGAVCLNEQIYDWQSLHNSLTEQNYFKNKRVPKAIPAISLAGGYPFCYTSLDDPTGMYMGQTFTGGNVLFDPYTKTDKRNSYSGVVVGNTGSGKSTFLKKLATHNTIVGNTTRILDVTGEFRTLVAELGGKTISLDGNGGIINPLQIMATIVDEKTNKVKDEESYMMHMSKMSMFYKFIAVDSKNDEQREFDRLLRQFYEHYEIDEDRATKYKPEEYPIMSQFLEFLKSELFEDLGTKKVRDDLTDGSKVRIESIILNIENLVMVHGSLFDGHSSINNIEEERIISFELRNLTGMDERIFKVQTFNILTLLWQNALKQGSREKMYYESGKKSMDEVKKFLLITDEAHNIINTNNIPGVEYYTKCSREFRKYFGGNWFATQNIRDFASTDVKSEEFEKIKVLFELNQYKFIMKQDPASIPVLKQILSGQVSESDLKLIPNLDMGKCILSISGLSNIKFRIEASNEELKLFKGGA